MKNDKTSRIVLVLEILLIVLLHMSKTSGTQKEMTQTIDATSPSSAVITTMQPVSLAK